MGPDGKDIHALRGLEERAFNAWPALQTLVAGGWILRFADGYTKRANSINAWRPEAPLEDILAQAAPIYSGRGLPLIVRVTPLADASVDRSLADRGFLAIDETIVMTGPLDAAIPDAAVSITGTPSQDWLAGFADANGVTAARRSIHDRMLGMIAPPAAFATLTAEGKPVAWGIAVAERQMAGLFDIVTLSSARRQGAGRRLVRALMQWARAEGAHSAYLQVLATNDPAIALYAELGFCERYRYHYRIRA